MNRRLDLRRIALGAALAAAALLFAGQQVQAVRLGFELERTRRLACAQRDRNAYLRLELERLASPAALAEEAARRLGMAPPSPESLVTLGSVVERPVERAAPAWLGRLLARAGAEPAGAAHTAVP